MEEDIQVLRVKETAKICGVHKSTIYRWEDNGELPFPKIQVGPGVVGFLKSDVISYLKGQRDGSAVEA